MPSVPTPAAPKNNASGEPSPPALMHSTRGGFQLELALDAVQDDQVARVALDRRLRSSSGLYFG